MVDGADLTVRTFRDFHRIEGARVVKMTQLLTPNGPSYRLTVRAEDGRLARYAAPTALLRRGTLDPVRLDTDLGSADGTRQGIAPHPADPARAGRPALRRRRPPTEPPPDPGTGSDPPTAEQRRADRRD